MFKPAKAGGKKSNKTDTSKLSNKSEENESFLLAANKTISGLIKGNQSKTTPEKPFVFPELIEEDDSPFDISDTEEMEDFAGPAPTPKVSFKEKPFNRTEPDPVSFAKDFHKYEQGHSRFYVDADKQYTAVITGVSNTLRHLNMEHSEGFRNSNVTVVFIRDCKEELKLIPEVIFKTFFNTKSLSVQGCGIVHMGSRFLEECPKLEHLDVRFNNIESVKGGSIKNCPLLKTIDFSDNDLTSIDSDVFKCSPELKLTIDSLQIGGPKRGSKV